MVSGDRTLRADGGTSTSGTDHLNDLVDQWRDAAEETGGLRPEEATRGAIFNLCADQLEAALDSNSRSVETGSEQEAGSR